MYAIVDMAGQQFKVEKDQEIYVHRLKGKEGDKVKFDKVLLIEDNGKVTIGTPVIAGAMVSAKIIAHLKDDKINVFKMKRRKGYKVLRGHRQQLSQILIESIVEKGATKTEKSVEKLPLKKEVAPKIEEKKKAIPEKPEAKLKETKKPLSKKPVKKTTVKKATSTEKTKPKATIKTEEGKKPAVKKAAVQKPATKKTKPEKQELKKTTSKKSSPQAKKTTSKSKELKKTTSSKTTKK
jgi:large subunit ribosomal protein L21